MKYMAIIDADEKPVSCDFIGCNGNVAPYRIGTTTNIKALKKEPCGDCISRQAVMEHYSTGEIAHCHHISRNNLLDFIEQLPSVTPALSPVTPKPKTGHWEWVQYDSNPNIGNWHCSECGSIVIECVSKEKKGGIPLYKYCPQCGAKIE